MGQQFTLIKVKNLSLDSMVFVGLLPSYCKSLDRKSLIGHKTEPVHSYNLRLKHGLK